MKRLLVVVVTSLALLGCAASQYKFTCSNRVCDVQTAGPATLDFQQEFGTAIRVVETKDGRVTMEAGGARQTFGIGDTKPLGPMRVTVKNVKRENAYFTVRS